MEQRLIYKILTADEAVRFKADGRFTGSADDLRDGFIHFSAAEQVAVTREKYFSGRGPIHLLAIAADRTPEGALKWEASRGGALFPHLYGELTADMVVSEAILSEHDPLPEGIPETGV